MLDSLGRRKGGPKLATEAVTCPDCGAPAGEPCVRIRRFRRGEEKDAPRARPHPARRKRAKAERRQRRADAHGQRPFGAWLRATRIEARLSQADCAARMGAFVSQWSAWEAGKALPRACHFWTICGVLGVTPEEIVLAAHEERARDKEVRRLAAEKRKETLRCRS